METDEAAVFSANFSLDVLYPRSEDEVTLRDVDGFHRWRYGWRDGWMEGENEMQHLTSTV